MANAQIPGSVLIIGAGVFGLTTAYELTRHPQFTKTRITIIDRSEFSAKDAASIDVSRIIRADYLDPAYSALAAKAQKLWRADWGADNRYHETGFVLTASRSKLQALNSIFENVKGIAADQAAASDGSFKVYTGESADIQRLDSPEEIKTMTGCKGASGELGYVNWRSGWADAEATMRWLHGKVLETGRVKFVTGTVSRLLFSKDHKQVLGAVYKPVDNDGEDLESELRADLTILAAGGWTSTLLDMQGRLKTTAQSLAYIPLTDAQAERLCKLPVQMNVSTGCFLMPPPHPSKQITFPPTNNEGQGDRRLFLKVARHAHGYVNPASIPHPEPHKLKDDDQNTTTSQAYTPAIPLPSKFKQQAIHTLPDRAFQALDTYLSSLFPPPSPSPSSTTHGANASPDSDDSDWIPKLSPHHTRLCHYTDTPTGDFLIDYHPDYSFSPSSSLPPLSSSSGKGSPGGSLFIATGGSGHAFKFAPVLGACIVQRLLSPTTTNDESLYSPGFEERWSWSGHQKQEKGKWVVRDGVRDDAEFDDLVDQTLSI